MRLLSVVYVDHEQHTRKATKAERSNLFLILALKRSWVYGKNCMEFSKEINEQVISNRLVFI